MDIANCLVVNLYICFLGNRMIAAKDYGGYIVVANKIGGIGLDQRCPLKGWCVLRNIRKRWDSSGKL